MIGQEACGLHNCERYRVQDTTKYNETPRQCAMGAIERIVTDIACMNVPIPSTEETIGAAR
jgi:hypothetical protein